MISSTLKENIKSEFTTQFLPLSKNFNVKSSHLKSQDEKIIKTAFYETFIQLNTQINLEFRKKANLSGSTGVSLFTTPKHLYCANIGDSECAVLNLNDESTNDFNLEMLSKVHSPEDPKEADRIIKNGGECSKMISEHTGEPYGPTRVWKEGKGYPGLMMTRSFGDRLGQLIGVSNIPDVNVIERKEGVKGIVMASDGLWELVDKGKIGKVMRKYYLRGKDAKKAAEALVTVASKHWDRVEGAGEYRDDITVLVAYFM